MQRTLMHRSRPLDWLALPVLVIVVMLAGCPQQMPGGVVDSDNDTVIDENDACPNTPAGQPVNAAGCAASQLPDDDGDLVPNDRDNCPNTPPAVTVDASGCPSSPPGTLDQDGDLVPDDRDACRNTPTGAEVDANGCADSQRDGDGDGVFDDVDRCPETAANTANGCPVLPPGTADADGDNIPDDQDTCPNTPPNSTVNATGCASSQRDADGDMVNDDRDACPGTLPNVTVNANGCPDSDGDGVFDDVDRCPTTAASTADGCPVTTSPVCGNGTVETGEQCDPPNGTTCSATCQTISGTATNDACATPTAISGTVAMSFSNVSATTDGPDEPGRCVIQGYTQVDADIWFCYTAGIEGPMVVSLCGSSYDTKMMVYAGCACPSTPPLACSDDSESPINCGAGTDSRARFSAEPGQTYMIRIGGFRNDQGAVARGSGRLNIFPENDPARGDAACNTSLGDCFAQHTGVGCNDPDTCGAICNVDMACCDNLWDDICMQKAVGFRDGFPGCGDASRGLCTQPHTTSGCANRTCCQAICLADLFCCNTTWDALCADDASLNAACR